MPKEHNQILKYLHEEKPMKGPFSYLCCYSVFT